MARRTRLIPPSDANLLTQAEQAAIRKRAQERVAKEAKQKAEDAFLEHSIEEERRATEPGKKTQLVTLDLAGHSNKIMLDSVMYFHGETYEVPYDVAATLLDIQARGWEHEDEVGGVNRDQHRPVRERVLRPGMEGASSRILNGL